MGSWPREDMSQWQYEDQAWHALPSVAIYASHASCTKTEVAESATVVQGHKTAEGMG